MLINPSQILFMITLMLGSIITISSSTWLGCWIGLEINLLSFIPMMSNKSQFSSESTLKYFLIQVMASSILLISILLLGFYNHMMFCQIINSLNNIYLIMASSLLMKLGAAPFHFWFPGVMEGLHWFNNLILMTWQKLAPFLILSYITNNYLLMFTIIFSIIIGSIGGLNQTSLRKLMAYSSINHLGWMLSAILISNNYWLIYFIIYSLMSLILILIFMNLNINHTLQIYNMNSNKNMNLILFCNLLSLGGLPPFLGFLPKWILIQILVSNNFILLSLLMVCFTLIALFFYVRIAYSAFLMSNIEWKWNYLMINNMPPLIMLLTSLNLMGLMFSPLINLFI